MSTRNISKEKRERLIAKIKEQLLNADDETKAIFNEVVNELNRKKYGIVWEEHSEEVYDELKNKIPVFTQDKSRVIEKVAGKPYNYIIEGDNLHALYLLQKTHKHKIDCIYIDPPYNTGARDWKYNNDYVDSNDSYRHSKWLSMMEHRLRLSKQLLNPKNSVLIVTIDEKEFLHLGMLLEEIFTNESIQMVSSVIKSGTSMRQYEFSRCNEYIFYVRIGDAVINKEVPTESDNKIPWRPLMRSGTGSNNFRPARPNSFYPIYVDEATGNFVKVGKSLEIDLHPNDIEVPEGLFAIWPLKKDGTEMVWGTSSETIENYFKNGYAKVSKIGNKSNKYSVNYITTGVIKDIEEGKLRVDGIDNDGGIYGKYLSGKAQMPQNQWNIPTHNATQYGTNLLKDIIGARFTFPKSLYAVRDCLKHVVGENKNAIILDYFAGSGTTQHAINLLNKEDGGHRACIMVTNNEVSENEAKNLKVQGFKPGDEKWENLGIAKYVTWPRTICTIEGKDINGNPLKGNYLGSDIPMANGFECNVMYYKTEFVNKKRDGSVPKALLKHVKELIQLDNHCKIDNKIIRVALSEDEVDIILESDLTDCEKLYIPTDVLLTSKQKGVVKKSGIEVINIPEYYFAEELREVDEV